MPPPTPPQSPPPPSGSADSPRTAAEAGSRGSLRSGFLRDMQARGLIHQATDLGALDEHLADPEGSPRRAYVGFDPTADSLTIGNLVGIMTLARFQKAGHVPVAVMGGGTGLIGDPSGKSAERQLLTPERVAANVASIERIFSRLLDLSSADAPNRARLVNNLDWLGKLSYLDALRDIGKHFSVNMMIQKESVKERLHNRDQGISYTEFSYMILQSYDFLHLWRADGVTLQMGGSDQWGNIVGGCDLIRRRHALDEPTPVPTASEIIPGLASPGEAVVSLDMPAQAGTFGLTWPLVTKADGTKFGKTESGAIWLTAKRDADDLSPARTSPYAYYQFWLNAADADVVRFLNTFTFLPVEEIAAISERHAADPGKREAQRTLAREATAILHGAEERDRAEAAAAALFSGDIRSLPAGLFDEVFAAAPSTVHEKSLLAEGLLLADVLPLTTLAKSKSEARTLLSQGSISVNSAPATAETRLTTDSLLHGGVIALRRGKKTWHLTRWA